MKTLLLLALLSPSVRATTLQTSCGGDQVSILCPQTITEKSTVTWSGTHTFAQNYVHVSSGVVWPDGSISTSAAGGGGGGGLSFVTADAPLTGQGTPGNHLQLSNPLSSTTVNGSILFNSTIAGPGDNFLVGGTDVYGRGLMRFAMGAQPMLFKLGRGSLDGDAYNLDSDGIVVYYPSRADALGHYQADQIRLTDQNDYYANQWFYLDRTDGMRLYNTSATFTGPKGYITTESSVTASAFFGDASHLSNVPQFTGGTISSTTVMGYLVFNSTFENVDRTLQVNSKDQFNRPQIWFWSPSSVLRMGANTSDGDPANVTTEGAIFWDAAGKNSGARIKGDRFGLTQAVNSGLYYWRADRDRTFFQKYDGATPGNYIIVVSSADSGVGINIASTAPARTLEVNGIVRIGNLDDYGLKTSAQIQALTCSGFPAIQCRVQNSSDYDLYTSTGASVGDWRNTRTGYGP